MAQNIYDDEEFFVGYSALDRSIHGLDGAPEWSAMRSMLPNLRGLRVVDLGCGFGWFCRWARENGAARVVGIDLSEKMLARARSTTNDPAIEYSKANLELAELPTASFELAYSSLAFHYLKDLDGIFARIHRSLVPGASLVFSVEHPIFMAPHEPNWIRIGAGRNVWPLDSYLEEGPRTTDWLAKGVVKQHRTIATYLNTLFRMGFAVYHIEEWGPTAAQIASRPDWADERERPPFLLVGARRV